MTKPSIADEMNVTMDMLCKDSRCPAWQKCYRYRAIPGANALYFARPPREVQKVKGRCLLFMPFSKNAAVLSLDQLRGI